jgi:hypothetical protein
VQVEHTSEIIPLQAILCHRNLIGVNRIIVLKRQETIDQRLHGFNGITHDHNRLRSQQAQGDRPNIAPPRAQHWNRMHFSAEASQVRNVLGFVIGSHKRDQCDSMFLAEIAQYVVLSSLGSGAKWKRQNLCQEENPRQSIRLKLN